MVVEGIKTICVVGAGTMGHQIALQCAVHNYEVHLVDSSEDILVRSEGKIGYALQSRVNSGEIPQGCMQQILSRLTYSIDIGKAAEDADFVIEAVYENVDAKRQIFTRLDRVCPAHTILASNTSSIRPSILADATNRPEKVLAMNFENPVWEYPLVEVMGAARTTEETFRAARELVRSIGLVAIPVKKEIQGYALNRIWRAVKREALHLADGDYASFEDIDRAFMIAFGLGAGPFMIMDRIGLDVILAIEEQYYKETCDESDRPPRVLVEKVKKGDLGIKTGRGFYAYPNPSFERPGWLKEDHTA